MTEQSAPDFSVVLRLLREQAHLTQEDLADRAGLSSRTISDLERGINRTARKATARLLADALGLTGMPRERFLEAGRGLIPAVEVLTAWAQALPSAPPTGVHYSLPPDAAAFTGRDRELDHIAAAVKAAEHGGVVAIHAIDGMAGVGKTALAVHVAHQLQSQFPDRQFFIDLHAHTPGQDPMPAEAALAELLTAVGVDARSLPERMEDRAAMWRDRMAGQRALLVLDNAASSAQVAPLLPGSKSCLVLVTSRRYLGDLPGAVVPVPVEVLSPGQAQEMFLQLAPGTNPGPAVTELTELAGYLPLAISLLARVLARHPAWSLADLMAEARASMLTLAAEDNSVGAAFEVSYRYLAATRQQFFRALGMHPGPTIDPHAAAALTGTSLAESIRCLDDLHREALLTEASRRRYRMHDLIRCYAQDHASTEPAADREEALERLLNYYQHAAELAGSRLARQTRPGPPSAPPHTAPDLQDAGQALTWIRTERANLLACLDQAARTSENARLIALTGAIAPLLRRDGPWTDAITRHTAAIQAAWHVGDHLGEANALNDLADVRGLKGDYLAAAQALYQALSIYRDLGSQLGEANALTDLGDMRRHTGDYRNAAEALELALGIYRDLGNLLGQANALNLLGFVQGLRGDYLAAAQTLDQALVLYRELGSRPGEADALSFLGYLRRVRDDYPGAAQALEQALVIYRELGDPLGQANALNFLGTVQRQSEDYPSAAQAHEQALVIYRELGSRLGEANALNFLGDLRQAARDYPGATQAHEQALAIYRDLGNRLAEANVLIDLGGVWQDAGDYKASAEVLDQALSIYRDLGDPLGQANALNSLGTVRYLKGDNPGAVQAYEQALVIYRELGDHVGEASALCGLSRVNR